MGEIHLGHLLQVCRERLQPFHLQSATTSSDRGFLVYGISGHNRPPKPRGHPGVLRRMWAEVPSRGGSTCCSRTHGFLIVIINACLTDPKADHGAARLKHEGAGDLRDVFFGRLVRRGCWTELTSFCHSESSLILIVIPVQLEQGTARPLIKTFDVKKRQYFGNTSMEAEISLLMANQTLVSIAPLLPLRHRWMMTRRTTKASPGKLIYDPFIGTGSMAYV